MHDLGRVWHNVSNSDSLQFGQLMLASNWIYFTEPYSVNSFIWRVHYSPANTLLFWQRNCIICSLQKSSQNVKNVRWVTGRARLKIMNPLKARVTGRWRNVLVHAVLPNAQSLLQTRLDTYIYQQKAFYICYIFTHTTLTVRIDAKLKKDCVSCFQTYHWVRDKGQGMDIFEESPLDSMTFLLQVIWWKISCHRQQKKNSK